MPWKALKTAAGSGWKEIDRAAGSGWKELLWDVVNIDVGAIAEAGNNYLSNNSRSVLCFTNPCNNTGILDKLDIYLHGAVNGTCRVGTVFLVSGTTYECRDAENVSGLNVGLNSDVAISLNAQSGDLIVVYTTTGDVEVDVTGLASAGRYYWGNALIIGNSFDYSTSWNYELKIYASNY